MTGKLISHPDDKVYDGVIDLNIKNNSHTIAYKFIIQGGWGKKLRILEVGCASGYFGEVLKNEGHTVWGIEVSPKEAEIAKGKLDSVYTGRIEDFLDFYDAHNTFDYITFGDVLEHLPDPTEILKRCRKLLSPDGRIIASIPNVAHIAIRLMLLEGRWEYSELGIMDDTHLRFFTKTSVLRMFSTAGFAIEALDTVRLSLEVVSSIYDIPINEDIKNIVTPVLRDGEQDVFQYVLVAQKTNNRSQLRSNQRYLDNALRVLCLLPVVDWSLSDIRIQSPLENWVKSYGGEFRIRSIFDFQHDELMWADVVVFQREANEYTIGLISFLQQHGKRVVFDIDDLLTEVPSFLSTYDHHLVIKPFLEQALQQVDTVTVSTHPLAKKLKKYNKSTFIVPNCAEILSKPAKHYPTRGNRVTVVVASSDTVRIDVVVPALQKLLADPNITTRLIGIGPPSEFLKDAGLPVECFGNMRYYQFRLFTASLDNAIGIIPLDDSEFSSCKSVIKYVDYALSGIPSVCSAVPPYSDVIENSVTGILVANDAEPWYAAMKELAISHKKRMQIVANAQMYCMHHFSSRVAADRWQKTFLRLKEIPPSPAARLKEMPATLAATEAPERSRRHKAFAILRRCIRPSAYRAAIHVIRNEGLSEFRKRLSKIV